MTLLVIIRKQMVTKGRVKINYNSFVGFNAIFVVVAIFDLKHTDTYKYISILNI